MARKSDPLLPVSVVSRFMFNTSAIPDSSVPVSTLPVCALANKAVLYSGRGPPCRHAVDLHSILIQFRIFFAYILDPAIGHYITVKQKITRIYVGQNSVLFPGQIWTQINTERTPTRLENSFVSCSRDSSICPISLLQINSKAMEPDIERWGCLHCM